MIQSYEEFTNKLITRFDKKDIEVYYRELAQLKQTEQLESYINEFQKIAVMVPDMPQKRITMLFVEGPNDRLKGLVKAHRPNSLDDAIGLAMDLEVSAPYQPHKKEYRPWKAEKKGPNQQRNTSFNQPRSTPSKADQESRNELRRKKLCFSSKEPWEPGHRCLGKGKLYLIEVHSKDEDESEEMVEKDNTQGF